MELTKTEKEIISKEQKSRDISNVANNQGGYGRLKKVSIVRKSFICRECKEEFQKGSSCYNQNDHTGEDFFPVQTKICISCGQIQIKNGVEVK